MLLSFFPAFPRLIKVLFNSAKGSPGPPLILEQQNQITPIPGSGQHPPSWLHGHRVRRSTPGAALAPHRAAARRATARARSPPPRSPGSGPRPAGLTLSWSHRTLLRFSSGARFRSRPINSSNNCAAEIMVLPSGGCSHQPRHPPTKTRATPSPISSARSQAEIPPTHRSRQDKMAAALTPSQHAVRPWDTPRPGRRGRARLPPSGGGARGGREGTPPLSRGRGDG